MATASVKENVSASSARRAFGRWGVGSRVALALAFSAASWISVFAVIG